MIGYIIAGLILAGLGALLLRLRTRALNHLLEIQFLKTTPVAELLELHKNVADEIGAGGFNQLVETRGVVESDAPITAELSGERCAHYRMEVTERYEETYVERDANGHDVVRTRTGSTTVASNTNTARFFVSESGGRVLVQPEGATLDTTQILDRFEPAGLGGSITFGTFSMPTGTAAANRRVLGYHYAEWILPLGSTVFVVAQASDQGGELSLRKPEDKSKPFVVSLKSKEQVTGAMESKARWMLVGAFVTILGGFTLVVIGIMRAGQP